MTEARHLAAFVLTLQRERAAVAFGLYTRDTAGAGPTEIDLAATFAATDASLEAVLWRRFGPTNALNTKLLFKIALNDFR